MTSPGATANPAIGEGPYPGLRAFRQSDGPLFFGRDREIRDLRSLWLANRLTILFGPSGVGKSSLLNAGVLSELGDEVDRLPVGRVFPAPFAEPAAGGNPFTFTLLSSWNPSASPESLRDLTLREFFRDRAGRVDRFDDPLPFLVAIDQFEELFMAPSQLWRHRDHFVDDLSAALADQLELRLLISIREDAVAALLPFERRLSPPPRRRLAVRALTADAALKAVTGPLRETSRTFGPGAAEYLVDDLRSARRPDDGREPDVPAVPDEHVEPVQLQIVCSTLWAALPESVRTITAEDVRAHGDPDRSLARFYTRTVAEVAAAHEMPEHELRGWIERNLITEMGTRGMVCEGAGETAGLHNEIVRALASRHLLRAEHRLNARWYELQHDRLIAAIRQAGRAADDPAGAADREPDARLRLRAAHRALVVGATRDAADWARQTIDAAARGADRRTEAEGRYLLGQVAGMRGNVADARTHFGEAIGIYETLRDGTAVARVLTGLGDVLLAQGRVDDAFVEYEQAVRRQPSDLDALEGYARAQWHLGHLANARTAYERILQIDPGNVSALAARGELLAELRHPREAMSDLERVIALGPDPARLEDLRSARALALAQLGRDDEAAEELRAAIEANPHNARTHLRGGEAELLRGRPEEALEQLREARRVNAPGLLPYQNGAADDLERRISSRD
ncbi:nSTAND1 domain-containing NTPase [Actinomadura algeriensis]|uniref:Tetratricopeptide (TPR) repeat protein n=1 Tax=Actinomadura algeriensis TaxID=1679523 RepID=A0ABR9JR19_9ACTN|nr:tetratricopeptide repeat protein [Actinomadura algeriensis]MBE1533021.1 tetratricopeptide (TPR) repeat protein [Actinomadura algeriensis]